MTIKRIVLLTLCLAAAITMVGSATPAGAIIWCDECTCADNCWRVCWIDFGVSSTCGEAEELCECFAEVANAPCLDQDAPVFGDDPEGQPYGAQTGAGQDDASDGPIPGDPATEQSELGKAN